jgi:hypothetical protein
LKNKKADKWHLNPSDVTWAMGSTTSGRRTHATRSGRASSTTSADMELIHIPSKISVKGCIEPGSYSRSEMVSKKDELYKKLFKELEDKVARRLKIPGR